MKIFLSSIAIIFCLLNSCIKIKHNSTKSPKNNLVEFYINDSTTQYFIKPIKTKSINSKENLYVDFTFRKTLNKIDSIKIGITLSSKYNFNGNVKKFILQNDKSYINILDSNNNFISQTGSKDIRILFKVDFEEFINIVSTKNTKFEFNQSIFLFPENIYLKYFK